MRVAYSVIRQLLAVLAVVFVLACPASGWRAGDSVDIEWKGSWWQGKVIEVKGDQYRIHYAGWSANWDEDVPASRLRKPTGTAQKGSGAE